MLEPLLSDEPLLDSLLPDEFSLDSELPPELPSLELSELPGLDSEALLSELSSEPLEPEGPLDSDSALPLD